MMLPQKINDASAWTAHDGGAEGIARQMGAETIDAIAAAVRDIGDIEPFHVTREMFSAEPIAEFMAAIRHDIRSGRGIALLRGLNMARFSEAEFARIHFGLGTHLGIAAPQSPRRDLVGYVQKEPNPDMRGYLMDTELGPHTDFHEILSLATVQTAESGGVSGFVSSAAVFNTLLEENPELVPALMEGFPYPTSRDTVTDYPVPSVSLENGQLYFYNYALFPFEAARILGRDLPPALVQAMRAMNGISRRPHMMVSFVMQPGEMVFWSNFKVQHSRTGFQNSAKKKRKLLRLWLNAHDPQPMARGFHEQARLLDEYHADGRALLVNTEELLRTTYETLRA